MSGSSTPPPGQVLHSWKEIAAYFEVSIRTVQNWEQDYELPVQRLPGIRGRVWARVEDLEAWRCQCEDSGTIEFATARSGELPLPAAVPDAPPPPRRRFHWAALVVAALLGAVSLAGIFRLSNPVPQIADCRLEGDTLVALDKQGKPLWHHVFPVRVKNPAALAKAFAPLTPLIADVDGEGGPELLYPVNEDSGSSTDELVCFGATEQPLWSYRPVFEVRTARGEVFAGPWKIRHIQALPLPGGGSDILVAVSHLSMFPGILARLDRKGTLLQHYVHAGHLSMLRVVPKGPGGRPVVYVAGNANSYKAADLIALDPDAMTGYSREPADDDEHTFVGEPVQPERARVAIPSSQISLSQFLYCTPGSLVLEGDQIALEVQEPSEYVPLGLAGHPGYYQVFDLMLNHRQHRLSDSFESAFRGLLGLGKIQGTTAARELERISGSILTLVRWH